MPESNDDLIILAEDHADNVPSATQYIQSLTDKDMHSVSYVAYRSGHHNPQELQCETITFEQFKQAMLGQEVHGTPVCTAYPVLQRESAPGQELAKQRVRVSFDFDVTCNDWSIRNASTDEQETQYSLALLQSFLVADKESLLHLMVDTIGSQLGLNSPESFIALFLPQLDVRVQYLFNKAIDELSGDTGKHWRELRDDPVLYGDWFGYSIDDLCACFSAKFIESSFEVIGGDQ
jgi:hypothetical protein